jgi:hypothetical protein
LQSKEYFKFVISKVENDFNIYQGSKELSKALYILGILKNSDNLLKDIYLISRIKNLKNFGNYLLFIYKKADSGEIKFDNLLDNLSTDRESIEDELINYFKIDSPENQIQEDIKISTGKEITEKDIPLKGKILIERKFKVEELDEELVTEEFNETDTGNKYETVSGRNYLELVQKGEKKEEKAFVLPDKEEEISRTEIEEEVFSLPTGKESQKISGPDFKDNAELKDEEENEFIESVDIGQKEEIPVSTEEIDNELTQEEKTFSEPGILQENEEADTEIKSEEIINEQEPLIIKEEETVTASPPIETHEDIKEEISKVEIEETVNKDDSKTEHEVDQSVANTVYMKYETELTEKNSLIKSDLDELLLLLLEENSEDRNTIIKRIIENSYYLEEYSREMSFEIITSIYDAVKMSFMSINDANGLILDEDLIILFRDAIKLIEGLIKGDEVQDLNTTIKAIEEIRNGLMEKSKQRETQEKLNKEKVQIERHLTEKYTDVNQRHKLLVMKDEVLEIENIFKSLETIKGKYQAYDALRTLSHTFSRLKEIAKIANNLEMRKMSQLTEASYIFIKFIQNYRMDPLDAEIKEIFKYIIYNFKLIYLDKPTKDIDVFISYLNDPIKIFADKKEI